MKATSAAETNAAVECARMTSAVVCSGHSLDALSADVPTEGVP